MKCIRCGHDSKHKERTLGQCPKCNGKFAFEPQDGAPVTDTLFSNAIAAVSGGGRIKWGVEHLYYEINRRKRRRLSRTWAVICLAGAAIILGLLVSGKLVPPLGFKIAIAAAAIGLAFVGLRSWFGKKLVALDRAQFASMWDRWCKVHGMPSTVIKRNPEVETQHRERIVKGPAPAVPFGKRRPAGAPLEADIADYSFDRAVICDRARTADLLIANNFHFENNCAILSIDGYPEDVFDTVKTMIKRNPRLHVFTLHDATPDGCRLATKISEAPDWFAGKTLVVDLGLRPRHAGPFRGLLQSVSFAGGVAPGLGIDAGESKWLSQYALELAAVRPEDVLKRLFRGIQAHAQDDVSVGGTSNCGSFDSTSSDNGDSSDTGGDSFG